MAVSSGLEAGVDDVAEIGVVGARLLDDVGSLKGFFAARWTNAEPSAFGFLVWGSAAVGFGSGALGADEAPGDDIRSARGLEGERPGSRLGSLVKLMDDL